jgi:hypothetical protein
MQSSDAESKRSADLGDVATSGTSGPVTSKPASETSAQNNGQDQLTGAFQLLQPSSRAIIFNFATFIGLPLIIIAMVFVLLALSILFMFAFHNSLLFSIILLLFTVVILGMAIIIWPALMYTQIKSAQLSKVSIGEALKKGRYFAPRSIGLGILVGFILFGGFLLFIVPGVIFLSWYYLAPFFMIGEDIGVREAMKRSKAAAKGRMGAVLGIVGVTIVFALVGFVPIIGGIASSILGFLYSVAPALRYDELRRLP